MTLQSPFCKWLKVNSKTYKKHLQKESLTVLSGEIILIIIKHGSNISVLINLSILLNLIRKDFGSIKVYMKCYKSKLFLWFFVY